MELFITIAVLLGTGILLWYFLYFRPKLFIQKFVRQAQGHGYRIKSYPFQFMKYYLAPVLDQKSRSLETFKSQYQDYDMIVGNMYSHLAIVVINKQLLKDLFKQLPKLEKNPFVGDVFNLIQGGGILFSQGQSWKRKRKIISSVFHFDFLNSMTPTIQKCIEDQIKVIDEELKKGQNKVQLRNNFFRIMSNVVAQCFFGTDVKEYKIEGEQYCQFYVKILDELLLYAYSKEHMAIGMLGYKIGLIQRDRKLKKKIKILKAIGREIVLNQLEKMKKGQNKMNKNMLTALYENNLLNLDLKKQNHNQYSIDELIGEFLIFFAAGTDTTSNAINVAFHHLTEHPQYNEKIIQQLRQMPDHLPKSEQLKRMKWIDAVFSEALRMHGPTASLVTRIATQNLALQELIIPKGSTVTNFMIINNYSQHNYQNAKQFKPQRWMDEHKIQPFVFTPFGGGQRNCIGQYLARIQAKMVMSKFMSKYQIKATHSIQMKFGFIYAAKSGQFEIKNKEQMSQK